VSEPWTSKGRKDTAVPGSRIQSRNAIRPINERFEGIGRGKPFSLGKAGVLKKRGGKGHPTNQEGVDEASSEEKGDSPGGHNGVRVVRGAAAQHDKMLAQYLSKKDYA